MEANYLPDYGKAKPKKMAPPRRVATEQLEIMLDHLEKHPELVKGMQGSMSPAVSNLTRQKWILLSKKLNSVEGGIMKTPQGWKRYWIEWRHKTRKKATDSRRIKCTSEGIANKYIPLSELEMRCLDLCGQSSSGGADGADDNNIIDDEVWDESDQIAPIKTVPEKSKAKSAYSRVSDDPDNRCDSPPPKWAMDLEERRLSSQQRMTAALESIAETMKKQEERRAILEERTTDAIVALAGTIQDLNSGLQDVLARIHPVENGQLKEEVVFL